MTKMSNILFLIMTVMIFSACSKKESGTPATFKLTLSGITNFNSGIGSGGAILFGKSSTGKQFGKIISNNEENIELANGQWTFYAVMWDSGTGKLSGNTSCAKTNVTLTGVATSIPLNLKNAGCADADFSGGDHYTAADGKINFPTFYIDECDELDKSLPNTCKSKNQGSALSYRVSFRSYERASSTSAINFSSDVINSTCMAMWDIPHYGTKVKFPTGMSGMPFVASVEMFLGTTDCGAGFPDTKGIYEHVFAMGLGAPTNLSGALPNKMAKTQPNSCPPNVATKESCEDYQGNWSGSSCSPVPNSILTTLPYVPADCAGNPPYVNNEKNIKQMVSIPKSFLCRNTNTGQVGADVFPGGNGTMFRPYKICNEWQLNQIGDRNSPVTLASAHYKLMNDLDMNKTDFGPYPRPHCAGAAGSPLDQHFNLNPLDGLVNNVCTVGSAVGFSGVFNGNDKTISHARISAEAIGHVGFTRKLSGVIKDLKFKNLEVRGRQYVGALAGEMDATAQLTNVEVDKLELRGRYNGADGNYVGGATGKNSGVIQSVKILNGSVEGFDYVGGLVGENKEMISKSMFRGLIENDSSGGFYTGGLVGLNSSSGNIDESFSEGGILSRTKYTGGIAGSNAAGINNVYSTMYISAMLDTPSVGKVGGIIGNTNTNFSNGYFDGVVEASGASPASVHMLSESVGLSDNYCFNGLSCGTKTYATLRADFKSSISPSDANKWSFQSGSVPRLAWESRECLKPINQQYISSQQYNQQRGSELNPIIVCNSSQFSQMIPNAHYKIEDDINLKNWTQADLLNNFSGKLEGNGRVLYGLNLSSLAIGDPQENVGIFKNNNGTIKNVSLFNITIENSDNSYNATGLLTGNNNGVIENIKMSSSFLVGVKNVGGISGVNSGRIERISFRNIYLKGAYSVGGVVGQAMSASVISKVHFDGHITNHINPAFEDYEKIGGIVGDNNGVLDQAAVSGSMVFSTASTQINGEPKIGGIVGIISGTGKVSNSYTENHFSLRAKNTKMIGGLVGAVGGYGIEKSFALGRVVYDSGSLLIPPSESIHPMIGYGYNPTSVKNSFYLKNSIGSYLGSNSVDTVTPSGGVCTVGVQITAAPALLLSNTDRADMISVNYYSGDISGLTPISVIADDVFTITGSCLANPSFFDLYKSYSLDERTGEFEVSDFSNILKFSSYNIAYSSSIPGASTKQDELLEYHLSKMYGRTPRLTPPVWELEDGESHPRLLQLEDN